MIVGDAKILAIESQITEAYANPALRALGFFVLHVGGIRYGVCEPDATMLANSFDEVQVRVAGRGFHGAPFAREPEAGKLADTYLNAVYADKSEDRCFGIPVAKFRELVHSNRLVWAPDGDEAFDDRSHVLQFDIADRVRLIAFKQGVEYLHESTTLSDVWMEGEAFYEVLVRWHYAFQNEWESFQKK